MEPTIVKPGVTEARAMVPDGSAAPVEAHQRAATLMAGQHSGQEVQVWAPDKCRLWPPVVFWFGGCVLMLCDLIYRCFHHTDWLGFIPVLLSNCVTIPLATAGALFTLKKPSYVTTDAEGIAVTGWMTRTLALRWDQILVLRQRRSLRWFGHRLILFPVTDGGPVILSLSGYPRRRREALLAHIMAKTGLEPDPFKRLLKRRAAALPPASPSPDAP